MKFNTLENSNKSSYKTFLTVILAIAMIGIMVLIGFWAYNEYSQYTIENDAEKAIEDFDQYIHEVVLENQDSITEETNQDNDNYTGKATTTQKSNASSSGTNKNSTAKAPTKKWYKGFVMAGYIQIPRTGIKLPILESVSTKALNVAVGKLMGPELNEPGNVIIMGHNYRNRTFFSKNANIRVGDKIYITDYTGKKLTYIVYNTYITDPDDSGYYTRNTDGNIEISLSSCTDDNKNRIIIWARVE